MQISNKFFIPLPSKQPKVVNSFVLILTLFTLLCVASIVCFSQNVGINSTGSTPDNSAGLDINFSNKGLLMPRVALTGVNDATTIAAPANSLMVYNTGTGGLSPAGYYYNSGTAVAPNWIKLYTSAGLEWLITGNAGTIDGTNFIGTTDNVPFNIRVNNNKAGRINPAGETFFGYKAGNNNTSTSSTGFGYMALKANTTGTNNTAFGYNCLPVNTTGTLNTAIGVSALASCTLGVGNIAIGPWAGSNIVGDGGSIGYGNTAIGVYALSGIRGNYNIGIGGWNGMVTGITNEAYNNVWLGYSAGWSNSSGDNNVMIGFNTGYYNQVGNNNTMVGTEAGVGVGNLATGLSTNNTFLGYRAGYDLTGKDNSNNVFIGYMAGENVSTGSNNIVLGYDIDLPAPTSDNTLSIGNLIFGNGINGTGTAISSGSIGIGTTTPATNAKLAFKDGHFQTQQTTAPTAAGTWVASLTNATDVAGKISFTTTAAVGTITITFNKTYTTAPVVVISPTNSLAAMDIAKVYVSSTTNSFTLVFILATTAGLHQYNYYIIETQ